MARKVIEENDKNIMYHHTGITKFTGCQCFKDCSCAEDFIPTKYDYYTVNRKKKKTTRHNSIEEAYERWNFVNSL